jgi:hypothetical protein
VDAGHGFGDGYRIEPRKDVFHERMSACAHRATRSMDSMQQLAHRDHTDRAFLRPEELVELV